MDQTGIDQGTAKTAAALRFQLAQMTLASQQLERVAVDEKSQRSLAALNKSICSILRVVGRLELTQQLGGEDARAERIFTDLTGVVCDLEKRMAPLLAAAGVELTVSVPEVLLAMVDEALIRQMLMELVSNGAKAKEGKHAAEHVTLTLTQQKNWAVFTVEDDGPGLPPGRLAYLFCSAEEAVPDWRRGGVGVAVARRVAELHGGTLVADCAEGRGLRVAVSVPLGEMGEARENLLKDPGVTWDQGGFDDELVALSDLLPAGVFRMRMSGK